MTEPLRLPVRVLVKGASTTVYTSWMGGPRSDFAWPRVIEAELLAARQPAEVRCVAVPAELTKAAYRTWPSEVLAWSPDVVILEYGRMECIHLFLPRALERFAHSLAKRPHPGRQALRQHLVRPMWKALAHAQKAADQSLPLESRLSMWRVRRGIRDIEGIIGRIRSVASPLVLILEAAPFGSIYDGWYPKANPRVEIMNGLMQDLVRKLDEPDVRFVPLNHLWADLVAEGKDVCPDGGHFSPELHRAVGEELGRIVLEWTEKQPHLLVEPSLRD